MLDLEAKLRTSIETGEGADLNHLEACEILALIRRDREERERRRALLQAVPREPDSLTVH